MPNLAMRQPGTQFSADGLDLSWPIGGEREVVAWPEDRMSLRIRRRIAEGQIAITDDAPTKSTSSDARTYRLLTGAEARAHFAEPAGPVTRVVYEPGVPLDEQDYQRQVQEVVDPSERAVEAAAERAKAQEEQSAAIANRQAEAERKAASKKPVEVEPDPIAERLRQAQEASAAWEAQKEREFMERERARQAEAQEVDNDPVEEGVSSETPEPAPEPDPKTEPKQATKTAPKSQPKKN